MSKAGLDNWKRDYPPSDRAIQILRAMVAATPRHDPQSSAIIVPDEFWTAHAEAQQLLADVDHQ